MDPQYHFRGHYGLAVCAGPKIKGSVFHPPLFTIYLHIAFRALTLSVNLFYYLLADNLILNYCVMGILKERFKLKSDAMAAEIKDLLKENGNKKIGEVTLSQIYQGMRGITGLVTETSLLDSKEGIRFRGYSIPELREKLPKAPGGTEPLPEGIFYLMLMGELPTVDDVNELTNNWARRSIVPRHVFDTLDSLPANTHPMTEFSIGVM